MATRRKKLNEEMPKKQSMGRGGSKTEIKVDMSKVQTLKRFQKEINSEWNDDEPQCRLVPNRSLQPCSSCYYYNECKAARAERKFILSDLDMSMVEELRSYQKKRNFELKDTDLQCNLNPKKDLEQCKGCRFYKKCKGAKAEREFIRESKDAAITDKRRKNTVVKAAMQEAVRGSHEIFEDEIDEPEDAYEDTP